MESFAERFKYLRNMARLSQSEFAQIIQLSQGRLSDIERGKNKPSADTLVAVADFFNISAAWLLQGTGKPPTQVHPSPHPAAPVNPETEMPSQETSLLAEYRKLNDFEKKQLWMFLDFLTYAKMHNEKNPSASLKEGEH